MLLAVIFLGLPTACKSTAYIVPIIQEPINQELPTNEPWVFTAIDESNYIISESDLKILTSYIIDLKYYGESGWSYVDYYKSELNRIAETFNK